MAFDPSLGTAHSSESDQSKPFVAQTLEFLQGGGELMLPIGVLAAAVLVVVLYRWAALMRVRTPSQRQIGTLLEAVAHRDHPAARSLAAKIPGPVGRMLVAGVAHIREPRDLIEEIMYERVLTARLRLNRMLPFIAITAASAPLLGLLGTVTGIIETFDTLKKLGSDVDMGMLSGGIGKALITTAAGLVIAIPALLAHGLLSRKARSVVDEMERAAVAFANEVSKTPPPVVAEEAEEPDRPVAAERRVNESALTT
jgi:biopolymer transport protein ExbB